METLSIVYKKWIWPTFMLWCKENMRRAWGYNGVESKDKEQFMETPSLKERWSEGERGTTYGIGLSELLSDVQ